MNTVWFTSDTHFGHNNIIKYQDRPWANREEMDEGLIANWNACVQPDDDVWHLGDFSFYKQPEETANIIRRLQGNLHLVRGNHDRGMKPSVLELFASVDEFGREIRVEGQKIVLCHYAMKVWNKSHRGAWQLYGHSHGNLADDPGALHFDVGVDCHDYRPISFAQVKAIMEKKTYKPVDHHGR